MKKVMLMPGHSVWDPGAMNTKVEDTEFRIVREVAMRVFCMDDDPEIDIVLKSRNKSYSLHPGETNGWNPDYIIELHLNAAADPKVQGCETLYWNSSKRSRKMAEIVQKHLVQQFGYRDRGLLALKEGSRGGLLLRTTKAPCVIVEGFFLSNLTKPEDVEPHIRKYAKAIRNAIGEICKQNI